MAQIKYDFRDQVVLITGGTSGIGLETSKKFLKAGAEVIICGRDKSKAEEAFSSHPGNSKPLFIQTDLGKPEQVLSLFNSIREQFGRLDVAVNNAAQLAGVGKRLHEFQAEEYEKAMAANLKSVWLCMQQEIQMMLEQQNSDYSIVNVSSINGLGGAAGGSLYSAAKAGVLSLSKSAAIEYATQGIRVNIVVPGTHQTPMLESVFEMSSGGVPGTLEQIKKSYLSMIPQNRIGSPIEAAEAILWLCSEGSSYITGHSLIVDGGMSAMIR